MKLMLPSAKMTAFVQRLPGVRVVTEVRRQVASAEKKEKDCRCRQEVA